MTEISNYQQSVQVKRQITNGEKIRPLQALVSRQKEQSSPMHPKVRNIHHLRKTATISQQILEKKDSPGRIAEPASLGVKKSRMHNQELRHSIQRLKVYKRVKTNVKTKNLAIEDSSSDSFATDQEQDENLRAERLTSKKVSEFLNNKDNESDDDSDSYSLVASVESSSHRSNKKPSHHQS